MPEHGFSSSLFSCIIYDSVFIRENTDKRKPVFWYISRSNGLMLNQTCNCCFTIMWRGVFRTLSEKTPYDGLFSCKSSQQLLVVWQGQNIWQGPKYISEKSWLFCHINSGTQCPIEKFNATARSDDTNPELTPKNVGYPVISCYLKC